MASSKANQSTARSMFVHRTLANYPMDVSRSQASAIIQQHSSRRLALSQQLADSQVTASSMAHYGKQAFERFFMETFAGKSGSDTEKSNKGEWSLIPCFKCNQTQSENITAVTGPTVTGSPLHNQHWQLMAAIRQRAALPRTHSVSGGVAGEDNVSDSENVKTAENDIEEEEHESKMINTRKPCECATEEHVIHEQADCTAGLHVSNELSDHQVVDLATINIKEQVGQGGPTMTVNILVMPQLNSQHVRYNAVISKR
jgi:hypothetical protein